MNHLFNFKAGLILLVVLICGTGLEARNTFGAGNNTPTVKTDTSLTVKPKSGNVLSADTTLVVKAGATIVQKTDTLMVINTDPKFGDEIQPKQTSEQVGNASNIAAPKIDTPLKKQNSVSTKIDTSLKKPDSASTAKTPTIETINGTGAPAPVTDVNGQAVMIINSNQPPSNTFIQKRLNDTTARVDTSIKKIDTTLAKKPDSALMKKSDTTKMASDTLPDPIKAQSAYIEVGGAGLAISANFDSRFHKERNGWGYRIGAGYFSSGGNTVFSIPFQINYLIGKNSFLGELGAGTTFLHSTGTNMGDSKWEFDNVTGLIATATIGFRYQPEASGLTFRIAFVPILYDEGLVPAGGVSIGWTFK